MYSRSYYVIIKVSNTPFQVLYCKTQRSDLLVSGGVQSTAKVPRLHPSTLFQHYNCIEKAFVMDETKRYTSKQVLVSLLYCKTQRSDLLVSGGGGLYPFNTALTAVK